MSKLVVRALVSDAFALTDPRSQSLADAVHLQARPMPKAPDGRYDYQVLPLTETPPTTPQHSLLINIHDMT